MNAYMWTSNLLSKLGVLVPSKHAHSSVRRSIAHVSPKNKKPTDLYIVKFAYWAKSFKFRVRGNLGVH